jgi:GcrA cell cycle regulator
MTDDWTDARVKTLREMWAEGSAASKIAEAFDHALSRSAILGKVARLKLQRKATGTRPAPNRVVSPSPQFSPPRRAETKFNPPADRAAALKKRPTATFEPPRPRANGLAARLAIAGDVPGLPQYLDEPVVGEGMKLIDLERNNCRFPFGHPNSDRFFFCGAVGADFPKQPYCPFHTRKAAGDPVNKRRFEGATPFAAGAARS